MTWKDPVIGCRPVTILGVGILDRRIACSFVAGGYSVHIRDPSAEVRQAAVQYLGDNKRQYARNIPGDANAVQPGAYGTIEDMAAAVRNAWLVVEAVPENIEVKINSFVELDRLAPSDCILGSNSLPLNIRTVELMTDGETYPAIFHFLNEILSKCGMLPVTARKESTGFISNRLWAAIKRDILVILVEGLMGCVGFDTVAFTENNYIQERSLDGSVMSARLDGSDVQIVIPNGCVHRVGHDGSNHEALVQRSAPANGDSTLLSSLSWCVGIAVDTKAGKIYWTQKGLSKSLRSGIFRSGIGIPSGQTASIQSDIELLFDNLPESIDPEIDFETRTLYWTDRDEHPRGYSLNQAFVGNNKGVPEILAHRVELNLEHCQVLE
ncbi:uncharacterized protein CTHT_0031640 [Thermochaetoides thermophila DSM 1495]|uniref:3-hydroxyacyl-CoA dehydrogenase NAD binding domain-containing protein n=1 Tax=Chaetomium thermophilum (strain DSM 1495 / CBS 144.50 / IMI 039719) TaxID=759272 RepID=G0S4N5_CHATD|nr:hypothetical protein CTHT_0031640 [Thermochaetoides thermophila DSM 1495]EGS21310.1 hypothetical protein CTHT_0031640 [Thermochaetoides thermophila DSM 1495]